MWKIYAHTFGKTYNLQYHFYLERFKFKERHPNDLNFMIHS